MYKICAVIVTYNRKELLARNLNSLLLQDYPLDVLIYDNASTDGTENVVYEYKNKVSEGASIIYIKGEANIGGSGGFHYGEKEAVKRGYDYIWLMDDDGYCLRKDTLNMLVKNIKGKKDIVNSYVTCNPENLEPTFGFVECNSREQIERKSTDGVYLGDGNPYNGTLVPRKCFEELGYTDKRFFIYGDEYEFILRTQRSGYVWKTVVDSLYYHPINRQLSSSISIMGKSIVLKEQPVWKHYLEIRNDLYIKKMYFNKKFSIKTIFVVALTSILAKDKKLKRLYYGLLAVMDAYGDNFDRPIMFNV